MRTREFDRWYPKYRTVISAIARKLAKGDGELMADLEQIGAVTLWRLNPEKAQTNPDSYIRKAIFNRMVDGLRKLSPSRYESLDARLEEGDQVEQRSNGDVILITGRPTLPVRLDGDAEEVENDS